MYGRHAAVTADNQDPLGFHHQLDQQQQSGFMTPDVGFSIKKELVCGGGGLRSSEWGNKVEIFQPLILVYHDV